jgi:hypothetical protein
VAAPARQARELRAPLGLGDAQGGQGIEQRILGPFGQGGEALAIDAQPAQCGILRREFPPRRVQPALAAGHRPAGLDGVAERRAPLRDLLVDRWGDLGSEQGVAPFAGAARDPRALGLGRAVQQVGAQHLDGTDGSLAEPDRRERVELRRPAAQCGFEVGIGVSTS